MMTKDELKKAAIRHALDGGRKFGAAEHRELMGFIASQIADNANDRTFCLMAATAMAELGNQSALQQALARKGVNLIDRANRAEGRSTLFSELAAEKEKS